MLTRSPAIAPAPTVLFMQPAGILTRLPAPVPQVQVRPPLPALKPIAPANLKPQEQQTAAWVSFSV